MRPQPVLRLLLLLQRCTRTRAPRYKLTSYISQNKPRMSRARHFRLSEHENMQQLKSRSRPGACACQRQTPTPFRNWCSFKLVRVCHARSSNRTCDARGCSWGRLDRSSSGQGGARPVYQQRVTYIFLVAPFVACQECLDLCLPYCGARASSCRRICCCTSLVDVL